MYPKENGPFHREVSWRPATTYFLPSGEEGRHAISFTYARAEFYEQNLIGSA
jgi:hypothetical protein